MSLMGSEGSLGAERIECPEEVMGEVADSVPVFPYACAIQYRRVRGRTLLPGSEWDFGMGPGVTPPLWPSCQRMG